MKKVAILSDNLERLVLACVEKGKVVLKSIPNSPLKLYGEIKPEGSINFFKTFNLWIEGERDEKFPIFGGALVFVKNGEGYRLAVEEEIDEETHYLISFPFGESFLKEVEVVKGEDYEVLENSGSRITLYLRAVPKNFVVLRCINKANEEFLEKLFLDEDLEIRRKRIGGWISPP